MTSSDMEWNMPVLTHPMHCYWQISTEPSRGDYWRVMARAHVVNGSSMMYGLQKEFVGEFANREDALAVAVPLRARIRVARRLMGLDVSTLEA
jgi:hypothetical protein